MKDKKLDQKNIIRSPSILSNKKMKGALLMKWIYKEFNKQKSVKNLMRNLADK